MLFLFNSCCFCSWIANIYLFSDEISLYIYGNKRNKNIFQYVSDKVLCKYKRDRLPIVIMKIPLPRKYLIDKNMYLMMFDNNIFLIAYT